MFHLWQDKPIKTWNPFVGCRFNCKYCWARRVAQRLKCDLCKSFTPHFHPERITSKMLPKNGVVFVCDMGDISFSWEVYPYLTCLERLMQFIEHFQKKASTVFFFETKKPSFYYSIMLRLGDFKPSQTMLSTTIETNKHELTSQISKAPNPKLRYMDMKLLNWPRKHISIEPIMDFDPDVMFKWITEIEPEIVSIGYEKRDQDPCSYEVKLVHVKRSEEQM